MGGQLFGDHAAVTLGAAGDFGSEALDDARELHLGSGCDPREVASQPVYAAHLGDAAALRSRILPAGGYYDLLIPGAANVDIWRTEYQHPMDSPARIVEWLRATGLKSFVDPLPAELRPAFLADYEERIGAAYPARADGRRLLAFPRLFIVATRRS